MTCNPHPDRHDKHISTVPCLCTHMRMPSPLGREFRLRAAPAACCRNRRRRVVPKSASHAQHLDKFSGQTRIQAGLRDMVHMDTAFFFFAGCFCSTQHSPNARRVTSLHKPQRTMLSAHQHVAGDSLAFSLPGAISPNNANRRFAAHSRPEYAPMAAWRQPSLYTKTASQPNMPPLHRRSWTPRDWQHNETRQEGVHRHRLPGRTRRKPCAIAMQNRTPPRTHVMAKTGFSNFFFFSPGAARNPAQHPPQHPSRINSNNPCNTPGGIKTTHFGKPGL